MPRKPRNPKRDKPSSNPLNNLDLSAFLEPKKDTKTTKKETYKGLQKEYERILHKEIQRENRAYRVVYMNHPELLYVAFSSNRENAKWQSAKYFKETLNPFFTKDSYNKEMMNSRAYRIQELDKFALKGVIPIPDLLHALDVSMPCSVCGKDHFDYSDYEKGRCFIVEGEGNLNPFTQGYILCYECHKKYLGKN